LGVGSRLFRPFFSRPSDIPFLVFTHFFPLTCSFFRCLAHFFYLGRVTLELAGAARPKRDPDFDSPFCGLFPHFNDQWNVALFTAFFPRLLCENFSGIRVTKPLYAPFPRSPFTTCGSLFFHLTAVSVDTKRRQHDDVFPLLLPRLST